MPHGHCYFWEPYLLWSHAIADSLIAIAYFLISILLINIYQRRKDFGYKWVVGLFALFIMSCGITHVFDVINLWKPFYRIDSVFRIITAIASLGTAFALLRITPALLKIPTNKQWEEINTELKNYIGQLKEKEKIIQKTNFELQKRIDQLHFAQELSKVGSYEINYEKGFTTATPQLHEIFGLPLEEAGKPIDITFFYEKVHPEDLSYIENKLQEARSNEELPELGYRILIDTQVKHIVIKSLEVIDTEGKKISYGSVMDITKLKESQLQMQALNEELATSNEELNATTEELRTSNEQLTTVNLKLEDLQKELEQRVTERTTDLQRTSQELQERNEELDQYVYKVSHDIRAPVASLLGLIYLMKQEDNPPSSQQYLILMENRIAKLDDFIRSVLNYSKILNTTAQNVPIDFEKIVRNCLDELTYYPDAEKLNVTTEILSDKTCLGDELRLMIVFKNIISNAIKYRNKYVESHLKISVSNEGSNFIILFSDNGIGIEPQYLEKIFQMFFRATVLSDGSGLGLYIVKQAVERLHGRMTVDSEVNVGTTFTLFLPC
ncbi:MAG: GHKL domain-containing protein [Verrucomicrobia bacterium]|nr:GHKL domain-containing protein [Cytophagales bacterium]